MHQDPSGIDMGGYGFRMRPMDMQKLGLLYLHAGSWKGQQLLPADWVAKAYRATGVIVRRHAGYCSS